MTESEFQLLREGDHLQFDHSPGRHGIYTGENTTRAGQIYIKIKEALEEGFHRISLISKVSQNQTISDYISKFEFSEPITIRQHLVYQKLCGRLAEVIYSMEATNTEFKAYQYKPVLKLLESPGKGILIADEVGLGKTIEAGLIWTELRARFNCNKLIVVCPANLRKKWVLELFERFDCDARECNGPKELFEVLDSSKKRETGFALVCSYQTFLPPGKNDKSPHRQNLHDLIEKLSIEESLVDLLVIDEAHYVRNRDTKTNQALRFFNEICNNLVLLSATPVHLGNDNLFSLLNLVDEDTFYDTSLFQQMVYGNEPIIKALRSYPPGTDNIEELKKHLQRAIQTSFFRNNEHLKVALKLANEEMDWSKPSNRELILGPIEKANLFNQYIVRNRKRDVEKERVIREVTDFNIIPSEEELELYENVISATISYAQKKKMDTPGFLLSMPERQFASCIPGTLERWQTISKENDYVLDEGENGEEGQIISSKKIGPLTSHLINSILPKLNISWFRNNDSKFLNLLNVVNDYFRNNNAKKIIIFSTFKSTLSYLEERFHENSIETSLISGDFSPEERWDILQNFENETKIKILLSSEVGSEGLDLQFCSALVNYDLPWNPMKIEQRIGRIDRIGQNEKTIKIFNLSVKKTIDEIIHNRLWKRIEIFESILGDVELILQNKINHLTKELYSHELTFEQKVELVEQTAAALERTIKNEKDLEEQSSDLVAFYDIINQKIENSRTAGRWISSSDIEFLFKDFFKTRFQPPSELIAVNANERTYEIKLSREASFEFSSFLQVNPGLQQRPSKFSHDKFGHFKFTNRPSRKGSLGKLECIDQFHPIIRFAVNEFKDSSHKIHPLSSCTADKNSVFVKPFKFTEINWAFFYVERWTFEVITTIEKLNFVLISDVGKIHEGLEVEKLLNFLSEEANFERYPTVETEEIEKAFETAKTFSKEIFERNELEIINDEVQKAKFQKTALERNLKSKVEQLKQKINEKNFKNPQRGISRAEKDIEKAKDNFYEQMNKIEKKMENFNSSFDEVCAGIITFD